MNAFSKIAKNTLVIFIARIIETLSGLFITMILCRFFKLSLFGDFTFVSALVLSLQPLVNLELNTMLVREIARDPGSQSKLLGGALILKSVLIVLFLAVMIVLDILLQMSGAMRIAFYLAIAGEIMQQIYWVISPVFFAHERMEYETLTTLIFRLIGVTGVILTAVIFKDSSSLIVGFTVVFAVFAMAQTARTVMSIWIVRKKFLTDRLVISARQAWQLFKKVWIMGIATLCTGLSLRVDIYFLKAFRSAAEIGLFQLPHTYILQAQILAIAVVTALFPMMSRIAGKTSVTGRSNEDLFHQSANLLACLGSWIAIFSILFAGPIVSILGGASFGSSSGILIILAGTIPLLFLNFWGANVLTSFEKQDQLIIGATASLFMNSALDALWVPSHGAVGAAWATMISYTLQLLIMLFLINRRMRMNRRFWGIVILAVSWILSSVFLSAAQPHRFIIDCILKCLLIIISGISFYMIQDDKLKSKIVLFFKQHRRIG